jgi:hypothetical protein
MRDFFANFVKILLFVVVPIFITLVFVGYNMKQIEDLDFESSAKALLSVYSIDEQRIINNIRQNLIVISKNSNIIGGTKEECNDTFSMLLSQNTYYANMVFIRPDGSIYCGAVMNNASSINERGEAFFEDAISTGAFSVGTYRIGRITQKPIILFGYPAYNSDGSLAGVVAIALDLDWLDDYYESFELPESSFISVIDAKGETLYHIGSHDSDITPASVQKILDANVTQAGDIKKIQVSESSGSVHTYFFKTVATNRENPLTMIISIDQSNANEKFDDLLKLNMVYLLVVAFVASLLGAWIFKVNDQAFNKLRTGI